MGNSESVEAILLGLPVHEMRLHIHPFEGSGDGLCGSYQRAKEPITVTRAQIIYQRRIAVLDHAARVVLGGPRPALPPDHAAQHRRGLPSEPPTPLPWGYNWKDGTARS